MSTLSQSNQASLKLLAAMDDGDLKHVVDQMFEALIHPETKQNITPEQASAQFGLATLIMIFVRQGSIVDNIQPVLKDSNFTPEAIEYITAKYKATADLLRARLATVAISYPRLIGCEWRLDYNVSNSETGPVLLPIFFIKFKLEGGDFINFTCNEEEMASLVSSLKEAASEAGKTSL